MFARTAPQLPVTGHGHLGLVRAYGCIDCWACCRRELFLIERAHREAREGCAGLNVFLKVVFFMMYIVLFTDDSSGTTRHGLRDASCFVDVWAARPGWARAGTRMALLPSVRTPSSATLYPVPGPTAPTFFSCFQPLTGVLLGPNRI